MYAASQITLKKADRLQFYSLKKIITLKGLHIPNIRIKYMKNVCNTKSAQKPNEQVI